MGWSKPQTYHLNNPKVEIQPQNHIWQDNINPGDDSNPFQFTVKKFTLLLQIKMKTN